MTKEQPKLSNMLFLMFAVLPIMFDLKSIQSAVITAALVCGAWWITRLLFRITRPLFPERLFKAAVIFWMAALGQIAWYHLGISPLWVISLIFILFFEGVEKRLFGDSWAQTIKSGMLFVSLVVFIRSLELLLGIVLAVESFHHSFGLFLILGALAMTLAKTNQEVKRG